MGLFRKRSSDVLAVELGNEKIKIIHGTSKKKNVTVSGAYTFDTPKGSVDHYVITDIKKMKTVFEKEIFLKIKSDKIMFVLDHPDVIKRLLTINDVDNNDLPGLVKYKLGEYLGVDMENYVIQFSKIGPAASSNDQPDAKMIEIFVVAIPKAIVEGYVDLCHQLVLEPYVLDLKSTVYQQLLNQDIIINNEIHLKNHRTICLIEIGKEQIEVNIYEDGVFKYNNISVNGLDQIIQEIADNNDLSYEETEATLATIDLNYVALESMQDQELLFDTPEQVQKKHKLGKEYIGEIEKLAYNIRRILLLYSGTQDKTPIDQILMFGDGIQFRGVENTFKRLVRPDIRSIQNINVINSHKLHQSMHTEQHKYFPLIGLMSR